MAGARREVRERDMRGLRRRKGFASLLRRLERRRVKKRWRRRWKSRMRERDEVRRTLGDFHSAVRRWGLGYV